ncbi:unnamed protein product [Chrysodeixis includens]|uniref:Uncharacterized protein n=1 Tax=Chrysodeixis includens TaxID=689277 RepID=A0A9P0C1R2_CHRIL|nr:unnamed protein product [Chrysodeixis includens]
MLMMRIHGVLYLIILFVFDSCDCKCDEYIIVLKETTCVGKKNFQPMKLIDVNLNDLTYPYNSTGIHDELDSFKNCILEVECDSFDTNTCIHHEPEHEEADDKSPYDLNIVYINDQNDLDVHNNVTADNMFMVVCDYAEDACDNTDLDIVNSTKYSDFTKDGTLNETMKDLVITLKRDEGSEIQPIFTGFSSKTSKTGSKKNTFLDVNLVCNYTENTHCERTHSATNSSTEILTVHNKTINVYLKSDYIKNNTQIKYTGCKKQAGDTKDTFNIECDATNFTYINQHILFTLPNNTEHESLNLHCQITEANLSTEASRSKAIAENGYNLVHFDRCYSNQNVSNTTDFEKQSNITLFLKRIIFTDNTTVIDYNTTKSPDTLDPDGISNAEEEHWFKMHITTDKNNNCSHNQLLNISEGKVIDKGLHFLNNSIPKYDDVELKLVNCLNNKTTMNNNITGNGQQAKLVIIFNNETDVNKIYEEIEEPIKLDNIIIACNRPYHDEHTNETKDEMVFACNPVEVNYNITTKNNSSDIPPQIPKEETVHTNDEYQTIIDEVQLNKCSYNTSGKTNCTLHCDTENVEDCIKGVVNETNNETTEKNDFKNYNVSVVSNKTNDSNSNGNDELIIGDDNLFDRIGLILLVAIAAGGLLLAVTLRKCAKKGRYSPAPVREPQDLEDTAF